MCQKHKMDNAFFSIDLNLSARENLPWYTISSEVIADGRYIRQSSGCNSFAIVTLKVEPYPDAESILFENRILATDKIDNIAMETICEGVRQGIREAVKEGSPDGHGVVGIKVIALNAIYHPVDSRVRAYKMATVLALREAFHQAKLVEWKPTKL